MTGWVCFAATWALAVFTVPPAIGHAFNLGREEGRQEGYGQRVQDEKNGIPATVVVPLPGRKERRHG